MDDCCVERADAVERLRQWQAATLRLVLLANAAMFVVELASGLLAGSVALLADSLDMLGDALRPQARRERRVLLPAPASPCRGHLAANWRGAS